MLLTVKCVKNSVKFVGGYLLTSFLQPHQTLDTVGSFEGDLSRSANGFSVTKGVR